MAVLAGIYSIDPDAILPDFDQIQHGLHGLFGSGDEKVVSTSHLSCILHQPDKQMALHETEDSCLFLEGELFDQNGAMPQNRSVRRIEQSLEKSRFSSLGKLNGMFCFIYWNKATRTLILGRDHFGSYPLFYIRQDNRLKFSSMLQPLLDLPSVKTQPDYAGISHLLNFGHWLGDHTFAEEIKSIPPGSVMVCRDGQIEMVEYWKPEFSGVPVQNPEQFFDELYDIWNQAVKRRIDEKTGFLLSGGIDSRMVASVLPEDQPIWTLTYGMPDAWDMVFARRIAKHIPVSLNMLLLDESVMPDFRSDLENHFLYSEGFPGLIGTYLSATSRHAANHVSILLEGTGGEITRRSVYRRFAHFNKNWSVMKII
jgi:asparagine synthetase B (glutamine-hydrolysing)